MKQPQASKLSGRSQQHKKQASNVKQSQKLPDPSSSLLNKRIVSPEKLKILVLSGNQLQNSQLDFLSKCLNLIKLDLSHNHITKLHDKFGIHKIKNLRVLNLEANKLYGLEAIDAIFGMESLEVFSFKDNPLEENPKATHFVVNGFPNLKIINYRIIFVEQRDPFFIIERKNEFISNDFDEWQPAEHTEKYYLKVLKLQLEYVDNMWTFHNPVVKIQRIWRAVLAEGELQIKEKTISSQGKKTIVNETALKKPAAQQTSVQTQKKILSQCFREWKASAKALKAIREELGWRSYQGEGEKSKQIVLQEKQYLTYELQDYYLTKRNLKIKGQYKKYLEGVRLKIYMRRMAKVFRTNIKLKQLSFSDPLTSYYKLSGLAESNRIYFNRVQQHLIQNFLAHIAKSFGKSDYIYAKERFGVANQYVSVRLMDPDTYSSKTLYNPLTYLTWPCMRCVILKKKKFPYKQKSSIIKLKSLTYIKNLNKHLTPQQKLKSIKTYSRIDKFFQHEYYESLGFYECHDEDVLKQLIRMIFYHNNKALQFPKIIDRSQMMSLLQSYTQNVSIYTEKLLERTTSAVKIQQQWRKYINNKKQKESIYDKLKKNRASRLIQRFLRDRLFYHRLNFHKNLSLHLTPFDDKDILVHENLYRQLPDIVEDAGNHLELYKGFSIQTQDSIKLYHSQFPQKQVFSPHLRQLHLGSQKFSLLNARLSSSDKKVDIYRFLHQNSQVKIIECKGQKFYQFTFDKVEDAKLRVASLALLTYRIYGSHYLLLLSKSTLHLYNERIKTYQLYNVHCRPFVMTEEEENLSKLKVNLFKDITQQARCSFLYMDSNYEAIFSKPQLAHKAYLSVDFYQKRYQDFPEKYSALLKVIVNDEQKMKEKQIEQKFLNIQKMLIKESELNSSQTEGFQRANLPDPKFHKELHSIKTTKITIITPTVQLNTDNIVSVIDKEPKSLEQSLNLQTKNLSKLQTSIVKTSEKHLSLYEIDVPVNEQSSIKKSYKTIIEETNAGKRQKVAKYLEYSKEKRQFIKEKKQIDLSQARDKRKFQKVMNMTLKNFNETERAEIMRKKAEKVKEYKRRSLSSSKADESEFMQQGNFIMEQQLKMNLMRNRIKEVEKIRHKRSSLPNSLNNSRSIHIQSEDTKSINSNKSLRQKKMLFEGKEMEIMDLEKRMMPSASLEKHSNEIFGGQTQVINKRSYVKKRSGKIGAYMRDPSMVHGVFPEEYYPIESGKGGIIFPRVG